MFKKALLISLSVITGILLFNTFRFRSLQVEAAPAAILEVPDSSVAHFQQAIRFQTVSYDDSIRVVDTPFIELHRFLQKTYPLVHARLKREVVGRYSLLFEWPGKNPALKPIVLMAHQDVVPVDTAKWSVDPFGGVLKDGFVWGRGTVDDKINLIAQLEAVERLLSEGFQPERTIYFVFGHDEEKGGRGGAFKIAALLRSRNVKAEFVLDEGGIITTQRIPGLVGKPVALIGTAEKGYLSAELSVEIAGGHSSMPEKETAIDVLSNALVRLREHPFPARLTPATLDFMRAVGPEMPFFEKMVFANVWLFKPLIVSTYEKSGGSNAMVRTTIAPTILQSGWKENVIPGIAKATVNFRIAPGDSIENVLQHVREAIGDERVQVQAVGFSNNPIPGASADCEPFQKVALQIRRQFQGAAVAPFLMVGATDSRHFQGISEVILKFSPMVDPIGYHGVDERLDVESYKNCIRFYYALLKS